MAQLTVRNLDEDLVRKLELRAAERGRSAEEEHRRILQQALEGSKPSLKQMLLSMPDVGQDADFERHALRSAIRSASPISPPTE